LRRLDKHQLALTAAVLAMVMQNFGPIIVRKGDLGGLALAFDRLLLAALVFGAAQLLRGRRLSWATLRTAAPGGLAFGLNIALYYSAVKRTSVANAAVIGALQPMFVLLVVNPLHRIRPQVAEVGWTAVSLVGVVLVVRGAASGQAGDTIGDLLAFGAMVFFTLYYVASRRARVTLDTLEYQAALSIVAAFVTLPIVAVSGQDIVPSSPASWFWVVAMVALPGTGHLLVNYAHASLSLSITSMLTLLGPVTSTLLAFWFLDQTVAPVQVVGMAIVLAALGVVVLRQARAADAVRR
jgi:drug/metabolite transporter (DMT)-like permease